MCRALNRALTALYFAHDRSRAAALLRAARPAEAACDCAVALIIDPSQVKAAGRLVEALAELKLDDVAALYAREFIERWPRLRSSLQSHVKNLERQPARGSNGVDAKALWWETDVIALVRTADKPVKTPSEGWEIVKAAGNVLFRSGSFTEAIDTYSRALASVDGADNIVKLLCNRAAAFVHLENLDELALMNATAAVILDPTDAKALHRRATSLHKLGLYDQGLDICKHARQILDAKGQAAFATLEKSITAAAANKLTDATPTVTTNEQKKRLDQMQGRMEKRDVMDANQLEMANLMLGTMPAHVQVKMFGSKILPMPAFHLELAKHKGWPINVNIEWAESYLKHVFEQSRLLPYMMEFAMKQSSYEPAIEDFLKRANGIPSRLEWLMKCPPRGSVCPEDVVGTIHYPDFQRQAFTNQAYRKELLSLGTVHVAVGFVDLGVLLSCDLGPRGAGPLRFVGVELSAFAVAKSLVIWQMVLNAAQSRSNSAAALSALQVWFSSTWEQSTAIAFRDAVLVVRKQSTLYGANADVSRLLDHWAASKGVPLRSARAQWADLVTYGGSSISNFVNLQDRTEMAAYELTGDVFVGKTKQLCGSICWWDCPDGTPPNVKDQTFLAAIDLRVVMQERAQSQSFFHAAEAYLLRRMLKMVNWARTGTVVVSAMIGNVADLIEQIAAMQPWTMSWSNVADYYKASDFHRIARACSINGDTMHFAYSMNWSTDVSGAHILDYSQPEARASIFEAGNESMTRMYTLFDWKSTLRFPPPQNPMNIADHGLALHYKKAWSKHWFAVAQREGSCQVGNLESASWNPLTSTGSNTILFTFTYDPEITFNIPKGRDDSFESVLSQMSTKELEETLEFMQKQLSEGQAEFSAVSDADYLEKLPEMILFAQKRLMQLTRGSTSS